MELKTLSYILHIILIFEEKMKPKIIYNVKIIKPINHEEIKSKYTDMVFKIIKERNYSSSTIEKIIRRLEGDRSNQNEDSSNL